MLKRLKHLAQVRAVGRQPPIELQIGYIKKLPAEYNGKRHVLTVGRGADSTYQREERRGAPASADGPRSIIRLFLVRAKDGRPDYSWPEDVHPDAKSDFRTSGA